MSSLKTLKTSMVEWLGSPRPKTTTQIGSNGTVETKSMAKSFYMYLLAISFG